MERRTEPRFYVGSKARILLPDDPQREIPAHVINVSAGGLRVLISADLSLGQHIVLDLPHHVVAAEVCNRQEAGDKFAVGVMRLSEVSKLDSPGSVEEQIQGLMIKMGWWAAPQPVGMESRKATEPAAIELPVVVPSAAAAMELPNATQPGAIELGESTGLAAVAMELPKAAEPKPAVIEWQVVEPAAPAIEFPKAPRSDPAAMEVQVVETDAVINRVTDESGTVETSAASFPAPPPLAPPPLPTHAAPVYEAPVHPVETRPFKKRLPTWVAIGAGLILALAGVAILSRTNPDARASVSAKPVEERPASATPVSSPPPASLPTPQPTAPTEVVQAATSNLHAFVITAREPSWLEIAVDGKTVFQKMVAAGATKQMEFSRVALLRIGNSAKVEVVLDSRPVGPSSQPGQLRLLELTASGARDLPWRNGAPILSSRPPGSAPQ